MRPDIIQRALQRFSRESDSFARPDHFAAETKSAINRADMSELEQHAVGIAMDDSIHGAPGIVTDRVGAFTVLVLQFSQIRNKLSRNWIMRVIGMDQLREGLRQRDGIVGGNGVHAGLSFGRNEASCAKASRRAKGF